MKAAAAIFLAAVLFAGGVAFGFIRLGSSAPPVSVIQLGRDGGAAPQGETPRPAPVDPPWRGTLLCVSVADLGTAALQPVAVHARLAPT